MDQEEVKRMYELIESLYNHFLEKRENKSKDRVFNDCRSCKYYFHKMKCSNKKVRVFEIYKGKEHVCPEYKKLEINKK